MMQDSLYGLILTAYYMLSDYSGLRLMRLQQYIKEDGLQENCQ